MTFDEAFRLLAAFGAIAVVAASLGLALVVAWLVGTFR